MKLKSLIFLVFVLFLFVSPANATLVSTFDGDAEGWGCEGDCTDFQWVAAGGNPGGYVRATDLALADDWYFNTTTGLGDWTQYIGGTVEYDIIILSLGAMFLAPDIKIHSDTRVASWNAPSLPGIWEWTHFEATLDGNNFLSAGPKTFDQIMADVDSFRIRGEYQYGVDMGCCGQRPSVARPRSRNDHPTWFRPNRSCRVQVEV